MSSSRGLSSLLQSLPEGALNRLYSDLWPTVAVYQSLSAVSRAIIMRLIFYDEGISITDFAEWFRRDQISACDACINELKSLQILSEISPSFLKLNINFRFNMMNSISNPQQPWSAGLSSLKPDKTPPSQVYLDTLSDVKWENALRYLVGAPLLDDFHILSEIDMTSQSNSLTLKIPSETTQKLRISSLKAIRSFLLSSQLLSEIPLADKPDLTNRPYYALEIESGLVKQGYTLQITAQGYEYMLKDRAHQVWLFIMNLLTRIKTNQEEIITLLCQLSFCHVGSSYPMQALTKLQLQVIYEMSLLGIIYLRNINITRFYPTRAAVTLLSVQPSATSSGTGIDKGKESKESSYLKQDFHVICETNNQVIAYTTNDLDISMLGLFVDIRLRMPNMVYGKITRDKAKHAYSMGISAKQIIEFLSTHAHPLLLQKTQKSSVKSNGQSSVSFSLSTTVSTDIVPANVSDQLFLWEAENYRIHSQEAVLFSLGNIRGFSALHLTKILEYMRRVDGLLWSDEAARIIVVTASAADMLQSYMEEGLGLYQG